MQVDYVNCSRLDACCFNCVWSKPATLSDVPILGYSVTISVFNDSLHFVNVTLNNITKEYTYCPEVFNTYSVSVAGINRLGDGVPTCTKVEVMKS